MGGAPSSANPIIVAAFHHALAEQAIVALVLLGLAILAWGVVRAGDPGAAGTASRPGTRREPVARSVLRVGFGLLWVVDGLLQAQQAMPLGLPSQVIEPAAAGSPSWLVALVHRALLVWTRHPIPAASATVWIQVGIGALLLLAPAGWWSRLSGVVAAGWGLVVWVIGESLGGLLAPGASWLFGAPGAAAFYVAAGVAVALPEAFWRDRRTGRVVLGAAGAMLVGFAVLQAWPGRGFWRGGPDGSLPTMLRTMAATPQPAFVASLVRGARHLASDHGWGVNLATVVSLASAGAALLSGRRRAVQVALAYLAVLSLFVWVCIQDLGVLGGVGTDPNSMIPELLVLIAGGVALLAPDWEPSRRAQTVRRAVARELPPDGTAVGSAVTENVAATGTSELPEPAGVGRARRPLQAVAALGAVGTVLLGVVPMASASLDPHTDPIVTEALNGQPQATDLPAPGFHLIDQAGRPVSLTSLRGRAVALTFLDPVCTSDCPLIAQQMRIADERIDAPSRTAFVAVVDNPVYRQVEFLQAFDRTEGLTALPNWYFLTGSPAALAAVWRAYGVAVETLPGGSMVAHSDVAVVLDPQGRIRAELGDDPGSTAATASSLATLVTDEVRSILAAR
jgi:cytochrome oxidase Cu insertion factor (SCO1/SenC/PrrC family)